MAPFSPNLRNLGGQAGDETRPTENLNGARPWRTPAQPGSRRVDSGLREGPSPDHDRPRATASPVGVAGWRRQLTASTAVLPMD